jgi:hypothetical protein
MDFFIPMSTHLKKTKFGSVRRFIKQVNKLNKLNKCICITCSVALLATGRSRQRQ